MNLTIKNDYVHDTVFGASIQLLKPIYDWKIEFAIFLVDDDSEKYSRQLFRSQINVTKLLQGMRGNIIMAGIIKDFLNAFEGDIELKFPFKSRNYTLKSFTLPVPVNLFPPIPLRLVAEVKHWVRVAKGKGVKKMELIFNTTAYAKMNMKK